MKKITLSGKNIEKVFIIFLLASFIIWVLDIFFKGSLSSQLSLFFIRMKDFWADFLNTVGYSAERDPYNNLSYVGWEHKQYPPLAYMFFWAFSKFIPNMNVYYEQNYFLEIYKEPLFLYMMVLYYIVVFVVLFELVKTYTKGGEWIKILTAAAIVFSFPVLFVLERGNNYLIASIFLIIFVFCYNSENKIIREVALVSLAISFGLKLTPAVFGILLIQEKKWLAAVRTAIYGLLAFFLPLFFFRGGINNFAYFIRNAKISAAAHSPFGGISILGSLAYVYDAFKTILSTESTKRFFIIFCILSALLLFLFLFLNYKVYKYKWPKILAIILVALTCGILILGILIYFYNIFKTGSSIENAKKIFLIFNYILCALFLFFSCLYKYKWQKILAITLVALSISGQAGDYSALMFIPFIIFFLNEEEHDLVTTIIVMVSIFMIFAAYRINLLIWDIHIGILLLLCLTIVSGIKACISYKFFKSKDKKSSNLLAKN